MPTFVTILCTALLLFMLRRWKKEVLNALPSPDQLTERAQVHHLYLHEGNSKMEDTKPKE